MIGFEALKCECVKALPRKQRKSKSRNCRRSHRGRKLFSSQQLYQLANKRMKPPTPIYTGSLPASPMRLECPLSSQGLPSGRQCPRPDVDESALGGDTVDDEESEGWARCEEVSVGREIVDLKLFSLQSRPEFNRSLTPLDCVCREACADETHGGRSDDGVLLRSAESLA